MQDLQQALRWLWAAAQLSFVSAIASVQVVVSMCFRIGIWFMLILVIILYYVLLVVSL